MSDLILREYDFVQGPETPSLPGPGTPSADADLVTKGFVNSDNANLIGSRSTPINVAALTGLVFSSQYTVNIAFVQGSGGAVTITANPQISAGPRVGARLFTILRDASKPITWQDGSGLNCLGGPVVQDVLGDIKEWMFDGVDWIYVP